jgi:hypothetical protein
VAPWLPVITRPGYQLRTNTPPCHRSSSRMEGMVERKGKGVGGRSRHLPDRPAPAQVRPLAFPVRALLARSPAWGPALVFFGPGSSGQTR